MGRRKAQADGQDGTVDLSPVPGQLVTDDGGRAVTDDGGRPVSVDGPAPDSDTDK